MDEKTIAFCVKIQPSSKKKLVEIAKMTRRGIGVTLDIIVEDFYKRNKSVSTETPAFFEFNTRQ